MKIQIIHRACGGTEFLPQPSRLHLGAQNAEGVDRLQFQLPESWADCAIALYLRRIAPSWPRCRWTAMPA